MIELMAIIVAMIILVIRDIRNEKKQDARMRELVQKVLREYDKEMTLKNARKKISDFRNK